MSRPGGHGGAARRGELFQPVLERPGLGGLPIHAQVSVAENVVDCNILAVVAHPPELEWAEYLDIKLREFAQSAELQGSIDAEAGK